MHGFELLSSVVLTYSFLHDVDYGSGLGFGNVARNLPWLYQVDPYKLLSLQTKKGRSFLAHQQARLNKLLQLLHFQFYFQKHF